MSRIRIALFGGIMLFGHPHLGEADEPGPATGQVIEGMVLNYNGGGIQGASVRIEAPGSSKDDPALAEGLTNQLGEIHLQLPTPAKGPVRVRIQKPGFVEFVQEIDPTDENDPPFIDVTLEGTGKLSGTVKDHKTDKPIAGARVECANGGRVLSVVTEADGRFVFENMVLGATQLTFMADGYGTLRERVEMGEYRVNLNRTLRPERPIQLVVEDNNGKPAADVTIEAMVEPDYDYMTVTTDGQGNAHLKGVSTLATTIHLRMNGERYVRSTEYVKKIELVETAGESTTAPASVTRRFTVRIGGGVKGAVVDGKTKEPIVGARVIAGREVSSVMPMTWTEEDGGYQLTGLEPGFNVISVQHGDYAPSIREVRVVAGRPVDLNMELTPGLPIEGVVVDAAGRPLDQVRVSADSWNGFSTLGLKAITGTDGKFSIPNAPAGDITFSFIRPGYGILTDQVLVAGKRDVRITLEEMKREAPSEGGGQGGRAAKLKVGDTVPDLTLTATDGTAYKLAELRGKYVFIDCWASWCGPCIGEIPNVKALREATRKQPNLVFLGISLDTDKAAFNTAVSKHDLDWPQIFGPKSGAQEAFDAFDGFGIPYMCLIGPDGKLLAQHLRGPGLAREVERLIEAPKEITPPPEKKPILVDPEANPPAIKSSGVRVPQPPARSAPAEVPPASRPSRD